jgi:vancomycin resistance protein YoaR
LTKDKLRLAAIYTSFLLCGSIVALFIYFFQIFNQEEFLPGVKIAGLPVAGFNVAEAAAVVEKGIRTYGSTPIEFYKDDYVYKTQLSTLCLVGDIRKTVGTIWDQEHKRGWTTKILNMDGSREILYPIPIEYNPKAIDAMVDEWSKYLQVECKNARLEIDQQKGLIIIPGQNGRVIARKPTLSQLPKNWEDFNTPVRIEISLEEKRPEVNEEDLKGMGELSGFSTWFNPQEVDRSHNLVTAAAAINGSVVSPGKIFSFNNTVGERIAAKGYRDAMVIVNGKFEPGLGGGVCQVSSTLYNACLLAGLNIVERHNHTLSVAYVPLGRDATVAYGIQDFRFKNNTGYPIYLRAVASGGKLTINIYGHIAFKQKIDISTVIDQVKNFQTVEEPDATLPPGTQKVANKGMPGYVVRSFRTFYDINGKVIRREQLARDNYQPLNKRILVGPPAAQPPVTPPPDDVGPQPGEVTPGDNNEIPDPPTSPETNNEALLCNPVYRG